MTPRASDAEPASAASGNMRAMWLKAVLVFGLIAAVETLHGILRVRLLNRRLGDRRARQAGVATGSALLLAVSWLTVPWIAPRDGGDAFAIGALWTGLMLAFEIVVGRCVFHASWARIAADFDVRRGGWLGFGMLALAAAPWLAAVGRGLFSP